MCALLLYGAWFMLFYILNSQPHAPLEAQGTEVLVANLKPLFFYGSLKG